MEESVPVLVSSVSADLSSLALSLTTDVSEEEELESRDMAEAELELDGSSLKVLSEASVGALGVAVLSSAATFCCGGDEAERKARTEPLHTAKSQAAGTAHGDLSFHCFYSIYHNLTQKSSAGSLMFVRLRAQSSAGKKKCVAGLHLGSAKTLPRRDAWLALSQERYRGGSCCLNSRGS